MSNVITVVLSEGCTSLSATKPAYQYDYGQVLKITGIDLPTAYQVHFSNNKSSGDSITMIGNADGVLIPDEVLATGSDVYAFLFLQTGESDGETEYRITIPVHQRPAITDYEPTPAQQGAIDQLISALNDGVEAAEQSATSADESAQAASNSATEANEHAEDSEAWAVGQRNGTDVEQSDETYHNNSKYYAEVAEQGASTGGFIQFHINNVGHLIYEKTANVDLAFSLRNGHLIVEGA